MERVGLVIELMGLLVISFLCLYTAAKLETVVTLVHEQMGAPSPHE